LTVFNKTIKIFSKKEQNPVMMEIIIVLIIVGAALLASVIFLLLRFVFNPRRVEGVQLLLKQGKISQAIRLARQILAREPRNADAHYLLGQAYKEGQKPELALMEYKTVNSLGIFTGLCREIPFRKEIAALYLQFNQLDEALKEYLLLVNAEPGVAEHYFHAGDLLEERGHTEKAALYFQKAVEIDPEFAEAYFRLGKILYRQKKPIESRLALDKAIKYDSENANAFFYLGKLLKEGHDYVGALVNFEKAEKNLDLKSKILVERGTCYMNMNNYENATSELERAVRLGGDESRSEMLYARYFLGLCYEKLRKFELAVEQWEKVYAKRPQFRDVADKLAQYQEVRTDDRIKDFLTASQPLFIQMCQEIVMALKLELRDISEIPNGCQLLTAEAESKYRGVRKMPKLVRVYRVPDLIDDQVVRNMYETMKKMSITKGIIITSSSFSRKAYEYAETRPIDLLNKDKLRELLNQTGPAAPRV
jgi:tetratricopeptide (TPR) repeat protein